MEEITIEPCQIEGVQQNVSTSVRFCNGNSDAIHIGRAITTEFNSNILLFLGGNGWSTDQQWHTRTAWYAGRICHMHNTVGRCSYVGVDDKYMYFTKYRSRLQSAQYFVGAWIAARTSPLVHWNGLGIFDAARLDTVSHWNRHFVLGEILWFEQGGRVVGLHRAAASPNRVPSIRHPLLSIVDDAQVRSDRIGHSRIRNFKRTNGTWPSRASSK